MTITYTYRPLERWTEPDTKPRRSSGVFRASWEDTIALLSRELELLDARTVVIQVDLSERDLRRDGTPKVHANVDHPGVRVVFESKHGPLTYATDAYEQLWSGSLPGWQANVRAVALGLEALRAVDRYGVTRRGEQYRGWNALPPGSSVQPAMSVEQACAELGRLAGWTTPPDAMDPFVIKTAFKEAVKRHHPDRGGDPASWASLEEAKRVVDQYGGLS